LLDGLHRDPGEGELVRHTPVINRAFSATTIEEILDRLDAEEGADAAFARETAAEMRKKSPTSLKVAFAQMKLGKSLDLAGALKLELRLASHLIESHDYREGIKSRIVGKGSEPSWRPATLSEVDDAEIESLFAKAPDSELQLDDRR
jgi:enoyl-CoA hydratase